MSDVAKLAHRSLTDHPDLKTPEAIADGPYGVDQFNAGDFAHGLRELKAGGRAVESFGGWSVVN